jgi:hypothetical protein
MKLIKYRESEMMDYIYFYVDYNDMPLSPTFENPEDAEAWIGQWDSFKPNKDLA